MADHWLKALLDFASGSSVKMATAEIAKQSSGALRPTSMLPLERRVVFDAAVVATTVEAAKAAAPAPAPAADVAHDGAADNALAYIAANAGANLQPAAAVLHEVVFVDSSVANVATLLKGIPASAEVVIIDGTRDGLDQIASALQGRQGIDAIHIISHGSEANLFIGTSDLNVDSMRSTYAADLAVIRSALALHADLLVYGCDFAKGADGDLAARTLSDLTGADVAASTNKTGAVARGADWTLEEQIGDVNTAVIVDKVAQADWDSTLTVSITTGGTPATIAGNLANAGIGTSGITLKTGTESLTASTATAFYGTFTTSNSNLGLASGVIIGTGDVSQVPGAPATLWNGAGSGANDANGLEFDIANLKFDFTANVGKIAVVYAFGSEEYNAYVGQKYNDHFGILLTGNNPSGAAYSNTVVSEIPRTSTDVAINSVNTSANSAYYRDNTIATAPVGDIVLGGVTVPITNVVKVTAGTDYTIQFRIADLLDNQYNSAAFISYVGSSLRVDLDANDSTTPGTGYKANYAPGSIGTSIVDTDVKVTNYDPNTKITSATATLTNAQAGDLVEIASSVLPAGITANIDTSVAGKITVALSGAANESTYQAALQAIKFSTPSVHSSAVFDIVLSDGETNSNTVKSVIHIGLTNQAPVIGMATAAQASVDGQMVTPVSVISAFADPNGDPLTYSATGLPAGLSIDPNTGLITGTIDHSASQGGTAGVYAVKVTASDGFGDTATETMSWSVTNPIPVATTLIDRVAAIGQAVSLDITSAFKDGSPDTDTLTYSASGLPAGLTINATTGIISGTLTAAANTYSVTVTANDGQGGTASSPFKITVAPTVVNSAPILIAGNKIPNQASIDGGKASFTTAGAFTDPNGDKLTYSATGLPAGVTINATTGVISGTLAAGASQGGTAGSYNVNVTASDAKGGTVSQVFVYKVDNVAPITLLPIPNQVVANSQAFSLATNTRFSDGGNDSDVLVYAATGLPPGLAINATTGAISGTIPVNASTAGPWTVTVTANDQQGGTVAQSFLISAANQAPVQSVAAKTPNQANLDGAAILLNASSAFSDPNNDILTYTATGLPPGLSINPTTGVISGALTANASQGGTVGLYTVTVTAKDPFGAATTETFTWKASNASPILVFPLPDQATTASAAFTFNTAAYFKDGASDFDTLTFTASGLPTGLTLNTATGIISGTIPANIATAGPYSITVTANDGQGGTVSDTFLISAANLPPALAQGGQTPDQLSQDGTSVSVSVAGAFTDPNGDALTYTASGLPPGLLFNTSTGMISGNLSSNASQGGPYTITIFASDGKIGSTPASETFKWIVTNPAPVVATPIADQLVAPSASFNLAVAANFKDGGLDTDTLSYAASGLPIGLSIDASTGVISGILPGSLASAGYSVTVTASDGQGGTVSDTFLISPSNQPPVLVKGSQTSDQNSNDGQTVLLKTAAAFTDPNPSDILTYSATGLPPGLVINKTTGDISGVLIANDSQGGTAGVYAIAVTANDGNGGTVTEKFNWTIANIAPVVATPIADQTVSDGQTIMLGIAANFKDGGADTDTLTYTTKGLPPGLTLNATTGVISGTVPANASLLGPYTVSVTANDGQGGTITSTFTLTSTNQAPVVGTATVNQVSQDGALISVNAGTAFSDPNGDALTFSAANLPAGLAIDPATGIISGTIDHSASQVGVGVGKGVYSVVVTASDGKGGTTTEAISFTIGNPAPVVVTPIASQSVNDGALYTLATAVNFKDGANDIDTLTYSAAGLPAGLTINAATGLISGTIPLDASKAGVGPYTVTVTANDGQGGTAVSTFTIASLNQAPATVTAQLTPNQSGTDGAPVTLDVAQAFKDPNGDPLTFTASGLPAGLTIDPKTGLVTGSIDHSASQGGAGGVYTVTVSASDGKAGSVAATETFTYTVANTAPVVVTPIAGQGVKDGQLFSLSTGASFKDGAFDTDTLSYSATGLPPGLTLNAATGQITGTIPSDASVKGPYTVTVSASDGQGGSVASTFTITSTNQAPIVIAATSAQSAQDGANVSLNVATAFKDGNGDALTFKATGLPAGLTLDPTSGMITGTIDHSASQVSGGIYAITVTATDSKGATTTETFVYTVSNPVPVVATPIANQAVKDGAAFTLATAVNFKDGGTDTDTLTYSATGLPAGLTINATTGQISGTIPLDASSKGAYAVTVTASDGEGGTVTSTFNITSSNQAPTASGIFARTGADGASTSYAVAGFFTDPNGDPLTFAATGLPPGLTIATATGKISGTLTADASQGGAAGVYAVSVTASDGKGGAVVRSFNWTISNPAPVVVTPIASQSVNDGAAFALATAANFKDGGVDTDTLQYSATGLPAGLTINTATGVISGSIPSNASGTGPFVVTVTADDAQGGSISTQFTITSANQAPVLAAPTANQSGQDGANVSINVAAAFSDPNGDALTYTTTSTLPAGLTLTSAGVLGGKLDPSASQGGAGSNGVYSITVRASDGKGFVTSETFTFTIGNPVPVVVSAIGSSSGHDGQAITAIDTAVHFKDGGLDGDALTYSATGLPAGLKIDAATGLVTGTLPADASTKGPYTVTVTANDGQGGSVATAVTISGINDAPVLATTAGPQSGADGSAVSIAAGTNFSDVNGDKLTFSASGLPAGLAIDPVTGKITGTLGNAASQVSGGVYNVTVTATDSKGATKTDTFNFTTTNPAPVVAIAIADQGVKDGQAFTLGIASNFKDGGADTDTLTYSATNLPAGLTINPTTGVISGTIPANASLAGPYSITVTANDGQGGTITDTFIITSAINPPVVVAPTPAQTASDGETLTLATATAFANPSGALPLSYTVSGLPTGLSIDANGVISGKIDPSASTAGAGGIYTVAVTLTDGNGQSVTETFKLSVANPAPIAVSPLVNVTGNDGDSLSNAANTAIDTASHFQDGGNDTDALSYSATGLPAGLAIDSVTGKITGQISAAASTGGTNGVYTVTVTASDGQGGTKSLSFDYAVANPAPVLVAAITAPATQDGADYALSIAANFKDGGNDSDALTYSATGLPAGLSINAATGLISGTVDHSASQVGGGSYAVTVKVSDGQGGSKATAFALAVSNPIPVVVSPIADQNVKDGAAFSLSTAVNFKDGSADTDTLTYSATGLPAGLTINATTGKISGTIPANASTIAGGLSITVTASDGQGGSVAQLFKILSANEAPKVVAQTANQAGQDGAVVNINAAAAFADPSSDTLAFTLAGAPAGLTIDAATGQITGSIDHSASQGGTGGLYTVTVTAKDSKGAQTTETFTYTVTNPAPIIVTPIADQTVKDGNPVTLDVTTNFKDGGLDTDKLSYSATDLPAGLTIDSVTGIISGSMAVGASQNGSATVTVTASDGQGGTAATTFKITSTNQAPLLVNPTATLVSSDGAAVALDLSKVFVDPNGDALTFTATGLPAGLTINPATGQITGAIDHSASINGPYEVVITANDGKGGKATETFTWTATNPAPVVATPIATQNVNDGAAFALNVAANFKDGGADTDALTYVGSGLPAGLAIDPATGVITGTLPLDASQKGPYTVTITVNDGQGGSVATTFTIASANQAPTTPVASLTPAQTGADGASVSLDVSGAFKDPNGDPLSYTATGLPAGLALDPKTGRISGALDPSASQGGVANNGVYTITVTASDGKGGIATETFTFKATNPAPVAAMIADQAVKDGASFALATAGNFKDGGNDGDKLSYSATGLPAGLAIDPVTGLISGAIPKDASSNGPYTVTVTANDGQGGTVSTQFVITSANDAPVLTATLTANQSIKDGATVTLAVATAFKDANGDKLSFSASGLPAGLAIDAATGIISGTVDHSASQGGTGGVYNVTISASDSKGGSVHETFAISVTNPAPIVAVAIPNLAVSDSQSISQSVAANFKDGGADTDTLTYVATGLPSGLSLDPATGLITGKIPADASTAGPYTVTVTASDGQGGTASSSFSIVSSNQWPVVVAGAQTPAQTGSDGTPVNLNISNAFADPNADALVFGASGLPKGLSIDPATGIIAGTIDHSASQSAGGIYAITVTAYDGKGGTASEIFTWTVTNPTPVVAATIPDQSANDGKAMTLDVSPNFKDGAFDTDALTYTATGLPAGLSIDPATGIIHGTLASNASLGGPGGNGRYAVTVTANDGQGGTISTTFMITTDNSAPVLSPLHVAAQSGQDGDPIALDVSGSFTDPNGDTLVYAATGLPPGLSIDSHTGVITGTIDHSASQIAGGIYQVKVTASDGKGGGVTEAFDWTITNPAPKVTAPIANAIVNDGQLYALNAAPHFQDGGNDTDALTYTATGLPTGLSINPVTGVISGTIPLDASQKGPFVISVKAADGQGGTITETYTLTSTNQAPVLGTATVAQTATDGASVSLGVATAFSDSNGDKLTFTATGLPPGLTMDPATGIISGVLDHAASQGGTNGSYAIVVTASDGKGLTASETLAFTATNPPPVVVAAIPGQTVADGSLVKLGVALNFADGGVDTDTLTYAASGLPPGLTIDPATGVISGTLPKDASLKGPYAVTITASDGQGGTVSTVFSFTGTNQAPAITTATNNQTVADGTPVTVTVATAFADPNGDPLQFTAAGLPPGLTIDPITGVISGVLDHAASEGGAGGAYAVTITADDGKGGTKSETFTITAVNTPPVVTAAIPNQTAGDGLPFTLGVAKNFADGGKDTDALIFIASGLPPGLSINPVTGQIGGTMPLDASTHGPYTVTVTATDSAGAPIATQFIINSINQSPVVGIATPVLKSSDGDALVIQTGAAFSDPNGDPLTYAVNGLPPGLSFNPLTGTISGTIDHSASNGGVGSVYNISVTASDGKGGTATENFTIDVTNVPPLITGAVPDQQVKDGQTFVLPVAGNFKDGGSDTDALSFSAAGLPPGLTIDPVSGVISGKIPSNASVHGPYSVTVKADDGQGGTITTTFTITSGNQAPVAAQLPNIVSSDGANVVLDVSNAFTDPNMDTLTYSASGLPPGLVINPSTGVISGQIQTGTSFLASDGVFAITVTASDGKGGTITQTFKLSVGHDVLPTPAQIGITTYGQDRNDPSSSFLSSGIDPGIAAEGVIATTVEQFGLAGTRSALDATHPITSVVNGVTHLGTIGDLPANGAIGHLLGRLMPTSFGNGGQDAAYFRDTAVWAPQGLTGFSLRYHVVEFDDPLLEHDHRQIVLDSMVRDRTLYIQVRKLLAKSDPALIERDLIVGTSNGTPFRAGTEINQLNVTLSDGRPLPAWLDRVGTGLLMGERPADADRIDLRISASMSDGSSITRHVTIDTNTGEIQPLEQQERRSEQLPGPTFRQQFTDSPATAGSIADTLAPLIAQ